MGNEHSPGSSDGPEKPEGDQVKVERDPEGQPAPKLLSDAGHETVKAHSDEGSASQTGPQEEEEKVNSFSPPAEETGTLPAEEPRPQKPQENSQEGGQPPSLSQSAPADQDQPAARQTGEADVATPPVEHHAEKAEHTTPQIPPEAASEPAAQTGVILSPNEGPSPDAESQTAAENLQGLPETQVQKRPGEITPCSQTEKERDSKGTDLDDGSFEIISEARPELAVPEKVEGHSDPTPAPVTKHLEAQSSVEAELLTVEIVEALYMSVEIATLPSAEGKGGQNKGHLAVDAQTAEEAVGQTASGIPQEAEREATLAQRALDTLEKSLACYVLEHAGSNADMKLTDGVRNDGSALKTAAASLGKEHPAPASVHDPEVKPLPDHLAEPPSEVLLDPHEAKELSPVKEMDGGCSGPAALEMADVQDPNLAARPPTVCVSCTEVPLAPAVQDTQPVATADAKAHLQGSPGAQIDSMESTVHVQKQEAKFSKTFYFCCSQHCACDSEASVEQ